MLEDLADSITPLPKLIDYLFKPMDKNLKDFHPQTLCIRLREFTNENKPSKLEIITTTLNSQGGYTDSKELLAQGTTPELLKIAKGNNYESWGELQTQSTEFKIAQSKILFQNLNPIGQFLKLESPTEEDILKLIKLLGFNKNAKIEKNAATLLANHLKLI